MGGGIKSSGTGDMSDGGHFAGGRNCSTRIASTVAANALRVSRHVDNHKEVVGSAVVKLKEGRGQLQRAWNAGAIWHTVGFVACVG